MNRIWIYLCFVSLIVLTGCSGGTLRLNTIPQSEYPKSLQRIGIAPFNMNGEPSIYLVAGADKKIASGVESVLIELGFETIFLNQLDSAKSNSNYYKLYPVGIDAVLTGNVISYGGNNDWIGTYYGYTDFSIKLISTIDQRTLFNASQNKWAANTSPNDCLHWAVDEIKNELIKKNFKPYGDKRKLIVSNMNFSPVIDKRLSINNEKSKIKSTFWRSPRNTRFLLIGVSDYKDKTIPKVANAVADVSTLEEFAESAGVPKANITSLTNTHATRNVIMDSLQKLKMATTDNKETAVFYFSGHGAPVVKNGKITDAVIVPYDALESSLGHTGIKISTIEDILKEVWGNWVVILDACFTGKEGRSLVAKNVKGLHVVPDKIIKSEPRKQIWWITSTSGDNYANDFQKQKQGLFTYYFIRALNGEKGVDKNGDGLITLQEAFTWTKSEVQDVSAKSLGRKQVPEIIGGEDIILTMPK